MTRSELIAKMATRYPLLIAKDVDLAVSTILDAIASTLAAGGHAELRGFGSFSVIKRPPRNGRNPKTGAVVSVPAKGTPHFKPGKEMRLRVDASAGRAKPGTGAAHSRVGANTLPTDAAPDVVSP